MTIKRFREAIDPAELIPDAQNANKGTERGAFVLRRSIEETGPGKAPVIDRHGNVVAGNKTVEMAMELGLGIDVIQTHGDALLVHQRLDLDLTDPEGAARKMSFYDNLSTEQREWEAGMLAKYHADGAIDLMAHFKPEQLRHMGIDVDELPNPWAKNGGDRRSYQPMSPEGYLNEGAAKLTFPGQRFRCGNHVLIVGQDTLDGEAAVMIRAWETYTKGRAELIEEG